METIISVTITGSSDMHYLDLYLINIFTKYRKAGDAQMLCSS